MTEMKSFEKVIKQRYLVFEMKSQIQLFAVNWWDAAELSSAAQGHSWGSEDKLRGTASWKVPTQAQAVWLLHNEETRRQIVQEWHKII